MTNLCMTVLRGFDINCFCLYIIHAEHRMKDMVFVECTDLSSEVIINLKADLNLLLSLLDIDFPIFLILPR